MKNLLLTIARLMPAFFLGISFPAAVAAVVVLIGLVENPIANAFKSGQIAITVGALIMLTLAIMTFLGFIAAVKEYREGVERRKKNEEQDHVMIIIDLGQTAVDRFNVEGYQRFDEPGSIATLNNN